jgi:catalase
VFFMRDPMKFPHFIRSQKNMQWDFWTHNPESAHRVTYLMGDRGLSRTWRHMNGYGSHTFMWVNGAGERFWVKDHFKTDQGWETFTNEEASRMDGYRRGLPPPRIGLSPDKMLLGRSFAHNDAQRNRIGTNLHQLPVNRPRVAVNTYMFDGQMAYEHSGARAVYAPNSTGPTQQGDNFMTACEGATVRTRRSHDLTHAHVPSIS